MSIQICIVEDNMDILKSLSEIIHTQPEFKLTGAFMSGEEAIRGIPIAKPDVVLMDIQLSDKITGIDCVKVLKPKIPTTAFMMCTIYEDDENIFDALKSGASGYLLKKTEPARMISAIKELAEGGAPMSSQIAKKVVNFFHNEPAQHHLSELSPRENEILQWLSKGLLYKEISYQLNISQETVRKHVYRIYDKLHVGNRTEAINRLFGRSSG